MPPNNSLIHQRRVSTLRHDEPFLNFIRNRYANLKHPEPDPSASGWIGFRGTIVPVWLPIPEPELERQAIGARLSNRCNRKAETGNKIEHAEISHFVRNILCPSGQTEV